jgi:hypothetical protein
LHFPIQPLIQSQGFNFIKSFTVKFNHPANFLLLLILLVACVPRKQPLLIDDWIYADLRNLDPVDAPLPSQDLIAIYTRTTGKELQVRLDFLDLALIPDFDLYLALDTMPGGRQDLPIEATANLDWDILLTVPASGNLLVMDSDYQNCRGMGLFTMRDFLGDTLTLSLNQESLSIPGYLSASNPNFNLQIFLTPTSSKSLLDQSAKVSTVSLSPSPARVLFVFWNTYPAYSPVTALRRWNGAHTGPLGGNHGLFPLLRTAQNSDVPLVLLDLKNPASLSALDFSDNLSLVKEMASQDGLILPDYLPDLIPMQETQFDSYSDQILALNRKISRRFGLPDSPFATAPQGLLTSQPGTQIIFSRISSKTDQTPSLEPVRIVRWRDRRVIPIQMYYGLSMQATLEGPALGVRQSLIETALTANQASSPTDIPILVLGGDLSTSTWGVTPMARATFNYLKEHPWIQLLTAQELLALPPETNGGKKPEAVTTSSDTNSNKETTFYSPYQPAISINENMELLKEIHRCLPEEKIENAEVPESICETAWQAYLALFNPINLTTIELPGLRANYIGQVWTLLEAELWAESPSPRKTCDTDPDRDGQPECILASENFYAQFEIKSGSLSHAFFRHPGDSQDEEIHQIIGPSSQFITGLSDPGTWDLSGGLSADPSVITGAFAENEYSYQAQLESEKLIFTASSGQVVKTYQLTPNEVHVEYSLLPNIILPNPRIPLVLDPWRRFFPGWAEQFHPVAIPNGWAWQLEDGLFVQIQTNAWISMYTFRDSLMSFSIPEDPNHDYPPGHFLPFPVALIEINPRGKIPIEIDIIPVIQKDLE